MRFRDIVLGCILIYSTAVSVPTITATPITTSQTFIWLSNNPNDFSAQNRIASAYGQGTLTGQPATSSLVGTYGSAASGATISVSASSQAGYGVLKAGTSGSFDITGTPKVLFADSVAYFDEMMTVSFAPWTGLHGQMWVSYTLDGTVGSAGVGNGFAFVTFYSQHYAGPGATYLQFYPSSTSGTFGLPYPVDFIYGTPFEFNFNLGAIAGTVKPTDAYSYSTGLGTGSAFADFSNTFVLSGLIVTDLNGNQVNGVGFTSGSGTEYTTNGVAPVPEPTSLLLLGTGLGVIGLAAWRRRK
jgi:hypothetical protein